VCAGVQILTRYKLINKIEKSEVQYKRMLPFSKFRTKLFNPRDFSALETFIYDSEFISDC